MPKGCSSAAPRKPAHANKLIKARQAAGQPPKQEAKDWEQGWKCGERHSRPALGRLGIRASSDFPVGGHFVIGCKKANRAAGVKQWLTFKRRYRRATCPEVLYPQRIPVG